MVPQPMPPLRKEIRDETEDLVLTVNIDNLRKEDAPESDPGWTFVHTYPSETVRNLIRTLGTLIDKNLSSSFITKGGYGTGKSHLLLLIYHLLRKSSMESYLKWLKNWEGSFTSIDFELAKSISEKLPDAYSLAISTKGKGGRHRYLWEFILAEAGERGLTALEEIRKQTIPGRSPDWDAIIDAVRILAEDKFFLLILDELDEWIEELEEAQEANYFFIDKLAEAFGNKQIKGLLVCTLRDPKPELEAKFERAHPVPFYPGKSEDRDTIIRFRLFEELSKNEKNLVKNLSKKYVESYKRIYGIIESDPGFEKLPPFGEDYEILKSKIERMWPLHPSLVEIILVSYDQLKEEAKEGIRGPLFIFMDLLKKVKEAPVTAGQADYNTIYLHLTNEGLQTRISDDKRFFEGLDSTQRPKYWREILNTVYIYSLGFKRSKGATANELVHALVREPNIDANELAQNVADFINKSLYVISDGERIRVGLDIKIQTQVSRRARQIADQRKQIIRSLSTFLRSEIFKVEEYDERVPIFEEITINGGINELKGKKFRLIVALSREKEDKKTVDKIWKEIVSKIQPDYRNLQSIIIPPRSVDLTEDRDLIEILSMYLAGQEIKAYYEEIENAATEPEEKQRYRRYSSSAGDISLTNKSKLQEKLKDEDLWSLMRIYRKNNEYKLAPEDFRWTKNTTYRTIRDHYKEKYADSDVVKKETIEYLNKFKDDVKVKGVDLERHFNSTIGLPPIIEHDAIIPSLQQIAEEAKATVYVADKPYRGDVPPIRTLSDVDVTLKEPVSPPSREIEKDRKKKVEEEKEDVLGGWKSAESIEGNPLDILSRLTSLVERAQKGDVQITEATISYSKKDVSLSNIADGLPPRSSPSFDLSISISTADFDPEEVKRIVNTLSAVRRINCPTRAGNLRIEFQERETD